MARWQNAYYISTISEYLDREKSWLGDNTLGWKKIQKLKNINFSDYNLCKNYSEKSDYLRFCILLEHGGMYVDTDFECYKNIAPLLKNADFIIWEEFYWVYNWAFMASSKENITIKNIFSEFHKQLQKTTRLCRTGPIFISKFIDRKIKGIKIVRGELLYPEYWLYMNSSAKPYANHHYAASWQNGINKKIFIIKQKISKNKIWKIFIIFLHYTLLKIRILVYWNNWYQ